MRHTTGEDFSAGKFLDRPGKYHAVITAYDEPVRNKKTGDIVANSICEWHCEVLAGTIEGQEGKTFRLAFFRPNPNNKDGGAFVRKILDRALLAVGVIGDTDKGREVELGPSDFVGRQFVVELEKKDKYIDLKGAEIYHVDDPEVSEVSKNEKALKGIPARYRRIAGSPPKANGPVEEADVDQALFG